MTIGQIDSQLIRHLTVIAGMNVIKHTTTSKLDLKQVQKCMGKTVRQPF